MILSHQTDRLERDHKVIIFRRVKIIAEREQNMFSVCTNETICTKDHTVLTFLSYGVIDNRLGNKLIFVQHEMWSLKDIATC